MSTVRHEETDSFAGSLERLVVDRKTRKTRSFYHRACVCDLKDLGCVVEPSTHVCTYVGEALESEEETRSWRYLKRKCGSGVPARRPPPPPPPVVSLFPFLAGERRKNQDNKRVAEPRNPEAENDPRRQPRRRAGDLFSARSLGSPAVPKMVP